MDLTWKSSEDEEESVKEDDSTQKAPAPGWTYKMWISTCPVAKPSVSFGPGRGGPSGLWRRYLHTDVTAKMNELKQQCSEAMRSHGFVIVPREVPVKVKAWFFTRRPNEDFISRVRAEGRLKPSAKEDSGTIVPVKGDIDNMAKFLLDALTGALYTDDAQVVELILFKLRDSAGTCEGRIAIECSTICTPTQQLMPEF